MKYLFLFFAVVCISCSSNKTSSQKDTGQQDKEFVSGLVNEIQPGKDGYTAKITTGTNKIYFVTVSRVNLKDPSQYKSAQVGDTLKVKGDFWKMENQDHIKVTELR